MQRGERGELARAHTHRHVHMCACRQSQQALMCCSLAGRRGGGGGEKGRNGRQPHIVDGPNTGFRTENKQRTHKHTLGRIQG